MRTKPFVFLICVWLVIVVVLGLITRPAHAAQAGCVVRTDWPVYTVVRGDTLYKIARRFNSTTAILSSANCLTNSNRIFVGQVLRVPNGGVSQPPIQNANRPITFQPYEGGYMVWWAESGDIWVLAGSQSGSFTNYPSRSYGGLPDNPVRDATPANRVRPIMGFGRLWGNFTNVRQQLGWATGPEQSYISVFSYDPVNRYYLFSVPGGRTLYSNGNTWQVFGGSVPTQPPPPPVPGGAFSVRASYQPFENGFMTWRSDNGEIIAYFGLNGGEVGGFPAEYYARFPDNPFMNVPAGRVRPILGFGRVWGNTDWVRERLGWATAPELGYMMQMEPASNPLYTNISIPAGAGGSIRWISNDRNRFWGFIDNQGSLPPAEVMPTVPVPTATTIAPTDFTVTTKAAYQVFENGFMIWRADTGDILTFPKQSGVLLFGQGDYQTLADNPVAETPPEARLAPINGFGRIWGNFSQVRSALGWAMDAEVSYQTTLHTTYVMSPDGVKSIPGLCLTLPDGRDAQYPQFVGTTATWGYLDSCG